MILLTFSFIFSVLICSSWFTSFIPPNHILFTLQVDPTKEQWQNIADVIKEKGLQPFFDNAYQGFASGDLDNDAHSLHMFVEKGLHPFVACSFAKNMGLYGERCGALHIVAPNADAATASLSQIKIEARAMYSNPPQFGAQVAYKVMTNPELRTMWEAELKEMSGRIKSMREALRSRLEKRLPELSWNHVTDQIGMLVMSPSLLSFFVSILLLLFPIPNPILDFLSFPLYGRFSYTGLTPEQVKHCADHGSLFMLSTGRISMAGLNEGNVDHVAESMANSIMAT